MANTINGIEYKGFRILLSFFISDMSNMRIGAILSAFISPSYFSKLLPQFSITYLSKVITNTALAAPADEPQPFFGQCIFI